MSYPRHPDYIPGDGEDENDSDDIEDKQQLTVAADGEVIPICYGRVQVKGKIFAIGHNPGDDGGYTVGVLWCLGEIQEIIRVNIGDDEVDDANIHNYLGTETQTYDDWLAANIDGYDDDLVINVVGGVKGVAYSVIKIADEDTIPQFTCTLRGMLICQKEPNPSNGYAWECMDRYSGNNPIYSTNPSHCLADFISAPSYGAKMELNGPSVLECIDANNEMIGIDGDNTEKTREFGYVIDDVAKTESHIDQMAVYAAVFLTFQNGKYKMVPDAKAYTGYVFDEDRIVVNSFSVSKRTGRDLVSTVVCSYTEMYDYDGEELPVWKTGYARSYVGDISDESNVTFREKRIDMPGIQRKTQAEREAYENLAKNRWQNTEITFTAFDEGVQIQRGDVIKVSYPLGFDEVLFRVTSCVTASPGRYKIKALEYVEAVYPASEPPPVVEPPDPEGLDPVGSLCVGETCEPKATATWTKPASNLPVSYDYFWIHKGATVKTDNTISTKNTLSVAMEDGDTVGITVTAKTSVEESSPDTGNHTIVGTVSVPTTPTSFSSTQTTGTLTLTWGASCYSSTACSPCEGGVYYKIRWGANGTTWEDAAILDDNITTTTYTMNPKPIAGNYDFIIRAFK